MNNISKTLSELTNSLSDESAFLTQALLKTKVLLHSLGHAELTEWVNHELNGYPDDDPLPRYRRVKGEIYADLTNGAWQYSAQPLPVLHLSEEQRNRYQNVRMPQSVSVLEAMHADMSKDTRLRANLPLELSDLLRKSIDKTYVIQRLWVEGNSKAIGGILTQIRSRLLDFVLGLGSKLEGDLTDMEAKTQTDLIDTAGLFKNAIFGASRRSGTKVFIGHGRSKEWKDLKDFIHDRMHLRWDEFNRLPVAGVANAARLTTVLDNAAIAFLVLTGEDESADGKLQARMIVVHEVGLFQGRLGFERAIVMLEDGCDAFSNIDGIGQIRFPKGKISNAFHEVQLVLEREKLIEAPE